VAKSTSVRFGTPARNRRLMELVKRRSDLPIPRLDDELRHVGDRIAE
jgi:hypothetical protein